MKTRWSLPLSCVGLLLLGGAALAATPAPSYSIDQTRYFVTDEIEQAERKQRIGEAEAYPAVAPDDAKGLDEYLHGAETLLVLLQRHGAYLHLRASRDIDDRADADASDRVDEAIDRLLATVGVSLRTLGGAAFAKQAAVLPALNRYAYLRVQAEGEAAHELPQDQQAVLDEMADPSLTNLWTIYQQSVRSTAFQKIHSGAGDLDARKDAQLLALDPDPAVRRAAWQERIEGYSSRAEVYSAILTGVVRLEDRVARLQHFPDAPSMVYFRRGLDRKDVSEALSAMESHADLFKGYQRLRAQHVSAMIGIAEVRSWDLLLPPPGFTAPLLTLDQTRATSLLALKPLGADYVEHFRQLLDPANGRMDVASEQGKRTNGGFSTGAPGVPYGLFVENYGHGSLNDSRVIVHEGGHAIHKQLMAENAVSPFYTRGPNWMFEAFATLNEFLLYDYLYQTNTDPKARAYYLEALLSDMTFNLFGSAEEGILEQSIYDGVVSGRIKNAADLDALTLAIWDKYEIWPAAQPQLAHTWMSKSLMVEDPLYLVNYLYSGLLATEMFDMLKRDPVAFQKRYIGLLSHGFHAPPKELLRALCGRDLTQRELVDDSMKVLQLRINALAGVYKEIDPN